jgi:hypothetical protein
MHFAAGDVPGPALNCRWRRVDPSTRHLTGVGVQRVECDLCAVHVKPSYDRHLGRRVHKLGDLPSRRPRVLMNEPAEPVTAADRDLVSRAKRSHLRRGLRGAQPERLVWALAVVVVDVFA